MSDRRRKLLFDAIASIGAARQFVADVDLSSYASDPMRRSATERQLEMLGEACSRLSREDADGFAKVTRPGWRSRFATASSTAMTPSTTRRSIAP